MCIRAIMVCAEIMIENFECFHVLSFDNILYVFYLSLIIHAFSVDCLVFKYFISCANN